MNPLTNAIFKDQEGLIEVREITGGKARSKFFEGVNAMMEEYKPPKNADIYFGVFTRARKNGTAGACKSTKALFLDFDNLTIEEVKKRLETAGLPEPSFFVNSGHGIHCYWILNEPAKEVTSILKGMARATGADPRPVDKPRVMRLPGTFNHKADPVRCQILKMTRKTYNLKDFKGFEAAEPFEERQGLQNAPQEVEGLNESCDRPCVLSMLEGVEKGNRNFALGRLTKYFQQKGKTKKQTWAIIQNWNRRNRPPEYPETVSRSFDRFWSENYKLLGCLQKNPDLQQQLNAFCDKDNCEIQQAIGKIKLDNSTRLNNRLFNDYQRITGNDLIILGVLNLYREGLNSEQLREKLTARKTKKMCMAEKTLRESKKRLRSMGLIEVKKAIPRRGLKELIKIKPQGTYGLGYTIVSTGAIYGAIDGRINATQLKVYVLLLKYAFNKPECYPSTATLAKELRTTRPAVTQHLNELERAGYIQRNYDGMKTPGSVTTRLLV